MSKILVTDDSVSMRQMISFTLTEAGHEVKEAGDGAEAFDRAKAETFDLFLVDVNMPKMNGIELTTNLRKLPNYKSTPILILTTETATGSKAAGKSAGATGWLVKPFNPEKLLATIAKVL